MRKSEGAHPIEHLIPDNEQILGSFFDKVLQDIRIGEDAPPFVLYSSSAVKLAGKGAHEEPMNPNDIDIITSKRGFEALQRLLLMNLDEMEITDLRVEEFLSLSTDKMLPRLRCELKVGGKITNLDVWNAIDDSGYLIGFTESVNVTDSTIGIPARFINDHGIPREIEIPALNMELQTRIYNLLERRRKGSIEKGILPEEKSKDRDKSARMAQEAGRITLH